MSEQPPSKNTLATRLLLSRRDLGWNQEDLAERSGVSRGHISNIERGHIADVGMQVVISLADALGVSPLFLITTTESANNPHHHPDHTHQRQKPPSMPITTDYHHTILPITHRQIEDKKKTEDPTVNGPIKHKSYTDK